MQDWLQTQAPHPLPLDASVPCPQHIWVCYVACWCHYFDCVHTSHTHRFTNCAARMAAGTAAELARQLVLGGADNGMALIRPLGHTAGWFPFFFVCCVCLLVAVVCISPFACSLECACVIFVVSEAAVSMLGCLRHKPWTNKLTDLWRFTRPVLSQAVLCHAMPCYAMPLNSTGVDTTEAGAYFNNMAVAVRAAQHAGARRVMVIDW